MGSRQSTMSGGFRNVRRARLPQLVPLVFVAVSLVITYGQLATMSVALASSDGLQEDDSTDLPYVLGEVVTNRPRDARGSSESIFIEAARPRAWHERAGDSFKEVFDNLAPWSQAAIISGVASALLLGSMAVAGQVRERRERRALW